MSDRSYRLRFWTMSMGRLTAHGDPQMFPLRTLKQRSWTEGARYIQLVGKLISAIPVSSPSASVSTNCPLPPASVPLLLGSWRLSALLCNMSPVRRGQTEGSPPRRDSGAWLQSEGRERQGMKAGWDSKSYFLHGMLLLHVEKQKRPASNPHGQVQSWTLLLIPPFTAHSLWLFLGASSFQA